MYPTNINNIENEGSDVTHMVYGARVKIDQPKHNKCDVTKLSNINVGPI